MREAEHHARALEHRRFGPGGKGFLGGLNGLINSPRVALRRLRDHIAARRVVNGRVTRRPDRNQFAAAEVVTYGGHSSKSPLVLRAPRLSFTWRRLTPIVSSTL